jgi:quinol monooxygenase YgiN
MAEILSMAVMEPFEGKEQEFERLLKDFYAMLRRKNYSRDELLRSSSTNVPHYVNIRRWSSEEARAQAHEDPDVHRYWAQIGLLCQMRAVYETLEPLNQTAAANND